MHTQYTNNSLHQATIYSSINFQREQNFFPSSPFNSPKPNCDNNNFHRINVVGNNVVGSTESNVYQFHILGMKKSI